MNRRPPRSTLTAPLFPCTPLFRSGVEVEHRHVGDQRLVGCADRLDHRFGRHVGIQEEGEVALHGLEGRYTQERSGLAAACLRLRHRIQEHLEAGGAAVETQVGQNGRMTLTEERSEERRGGKECVSTCRTRWWPTH